MSFTLLVSWSLIVVALYVLNELVLKRRTKRLPLPPGPKGLPLVGNVKDLPPSGEKEYLHWLKFKDAYGPITSLTVLGQTIVIIHDRNIASELMDKRASIHSGRPVMPFGNSCGWEGVMGAQQNNASFRGQRKHVFQQVGTKNLVSKYWSLQEGVVGRFLWRANEDNGRNLLQNLQTEAAELILKATYGYTTEPHSADPLVDLVDEVMEQFSQAFVPGKWAVDLIPALQYLPEWFPGTGWKQTAKLWKQTMIDVINIPFEYAKLPQDNNDEPSFVSKALAQHDEVKGGPSPADISTVKLAAVSLYTGGADTTVSTMQSFFLAMAMHPTVQAKAHAELDALLGPNPTRLPTFTDRDQLPYISLIVEEAQRWHPVAPMGLPHRTDKEDTIAGYRIPKDAVLMPTIWWYTRDEAFYHDPETFKPERFEEPYNEPYATNVTFGFGRRRCPGHLFADASLYLIMAQALAVFDIKPGVDDEGKEVKLTHGFQHGVIGRPTPFEVRLLPRSEAHGELIGSTVEKHGWKESGAAVIRKMMAERV
ncbi:putative cytochrome P450 oxidoreductase OrdA-like protein [Macroventuria anomochaeta]|uniref:Cytochrome P450 oxidoreductase OrdA-like protein n=1 Tax=Macroventuria anomochaeta TaxID=301207 RepID=A0ACB6SFM6_9PLEO|nr:putative cytochrome P450 oxidoreductase OrdA-like protein [Macroventuria anomochaeta]KAF2631897.1 putative cytochrome P450 oxidoreductase OrdA-like protein [Macroventuria anomochaeta]